MDDKSKVKLDLILDTYGTVEILDYIAHLLELQEDVICQKQANLLAAIAQILQEIEDCRKKILEDKV